MVALIPLHHRLMALLACFTSYKFNGCYTSPTECHSSSTWDDAGSTECLLCSLLVSFSSKDLVIVYVLHFCLLNIFFMLLCLGYNFILTSLFSYGWHSVLWFGYHVEFSMKFDMLSLVPMVAYAICLCQKDENRKDDMRIYLNVIFMTYIRKEKYMYKRYGEYMNHMWYLKFSIPYKLVANRFCLS